MPPLSNHPSRSTSRATLTQGSEPWGLLVAGLFGLLLGVGLLKFGNPILLDRLVDLPKTPEEWRVFSWPIRIGHMALALVTGLGLVFLATCRQRSPSMPRGLLALFVGWFLCQGLATGTSIDAGTSRLVLGHFLSLAACLFVGHWCLSRVSELRVFWMCLVFAFLAALVFAIEQRLGGLETTRRMLLERPEAANFPPEYLARIRSNRVFSTFVYPNALAGAILLLLPITTVLAGAFGLRWGILGQRTLGAATCLLGLLVLVWSGSKAGWLITMGLLLLLLAHAPIPTRVRWIVGSVFVLAGLTAFLVVFREKLARGPTSASARIDYWQAAWHGFRERPFFGQGPGAFKKVYARVKRPESEMAQLAHNDYLQQATDSGFIGFFCYSGFIVGSLTWLYRERHKQPPPLRNPLTTAVGLGLLGWFLHGLVEFGLYIPATSWCAFALLGWALAQFRSVPPLGPAIASENRAASR